METLWQELVWLVQVECAGKNECNLNGWQRRWCEVKKEPADFMWIHQWNESAPPTCYQQEKQSEMAQLIGNCLLPARIPVRNKEKKTGLVTGNTTNKAQRQPRCKDSLRRRCGVAGVTAAMANMMTTLRLSFSSSSSSSYSASPSPLLPLFIFSFLFTYLIIISLSLSLSFFRRFFAVWGKRRHKAEGVGHIFFSFFFKFFAFFPHFFCVLSSGCFYRTLIGTLLLHCWCCRCCFHAQGRGKPSEQIAIASISFRLPFSVVGTCRDFPPKLFAVLERF